MRVGAPVRHVTKRPFTVRNPGTECFRACVVALLALWLSGCLGIREGEEPQFDVCLRQIETFVSQHFGQHVTNVEFFYVYERRDLQRWDWSKAVVRVAECPGYHYFEIMATADTCELLPHYGRQPNYVFYRGAFDGC